MSDRIPCVVPHCRRTARREPADDETTEVICGKHWRMIDKAVRARHKQMKRRQDWLDRQWEKDGGDDIADAVNPKWPRIIRRWVRLRRKAWAHCKRQAIEAAGGIA